VGKTAGRCAGPGGRSPPSRAGLPPPSPGAAPLLPPPRKSPPELFPGEDPPPLVNQQSFSPPRTHRSLRASPQDAGLVRGHTAPGTSADRGCRARRAGPESPHRPQKYPHLAAPGGSPRGGGNGERPRDPGCGRVPASSPPRRVPFACGTSEGFQNSPGDPAASPGGGKARPRDPPK